MNPLKRYYSMLEMKVQLFKFFEMPRFSNKKVVNRLQGDVTGRLKLGIDLKGGVEFIVVFDPAELEGTEEELLSS